MKKHFYLILLFTGQISFGQTPKKIIIPIYQNSNNKNDTSAWYKDYFKLGRTLKLPNLQETNDTFYFRLWTHNQVVDIWTFDNVKIFGVVINFAERYNSKLLKKGQYVVDKVFFKSKKLDSIYAKNIFTAIKNLKLMDIPSDEKINGWSQGLDGTEYLIETSINILFENKKGKFGVFNSLLSAIT